MTKFLRVIAAVVVILLILFGITRWLGQQQDPTPPQGGDSTDIVQPAHCPDVEVIAAPGTWESNAADDPYLPTANPASFMLSITQPLQAANDPARVKVWTLPYTAQFRNINALGELSYDDSRNEGIDRLTEEMVATYTECPLTDFILTGFSQGAVIMGDTASEIGNGRHAIPAERIRGVALIADGRREPGVGVTIGNPVAGVGAEVALHRLNLVVQAVVPGATMRGSRAGGFGVLQDKVADICATDDAICDAPLDVTDALPRAADMVAANGVHAWYASNEYVIPGTTANQWVVGWAQELINN